MEAADQHGVSLNVPLMHDESKDVEAHDHNGDQDAVSCTTSFYKTCFNGLNALSGSYFP
jgi:hypothetical protein